VRESVPVTTVTEGMDCWLASGPRVSIEMLGLVGCFVEDCSRGRYLSL